MFIDFCINSHSNRYISMTYPVHYSLNINIIAYAISYKYMS